MTLKEAEVNLHVLQFDYETYGYFEFVNSGHQTIWNGCAMTILLVQLDINLSTKRLRWYNERSDTLRWSYRVTHGLTRYILAFLRCMSIANEFAPKWAHINPELRLSLKQSYTAPEVRGRLNAQRATSFNEFDWQSQQASRAHDTCSRGPNDSR